MSFEEEIRNRFLADTASILEDSLDEVDGMFKFHEDGTINISSDYRNARPQEQILIYLIARRYQYEAGIVESPDLGYDYFYRVYSDKDKSTIRKYFQELRDRGLVQKADDGHQLVVERLDESISQIDSSAIGGTSG